MKKFKVFLIPLLAVLIFFSQHPKVKGEIDEAWRNFFRLVRKAFAYVSAFLTKNIHDEIEFTVLEEEN